MSSKRLPRITAGEKAAIYKDWLTDQFTVKDLMKRHRRDFYTVSAACKKPKRASALAPSVAQVNDALDAAHADHQGHSALFKQIFTLVKQQAPEVNRIVLDVEHKQVTFETRTEHKVSL